MKGTIVRKRDEGYGFIKPENDDKDVFFHASSISEGTFDDYKEGDVIMFDIEQGPKGPAATNVRRPEEAATETEAAPAEETPAE